MYMHAQHKIIPSESYNTLKLEGELHPDSVILLDEEYAQLLDPPKPLVVQCQSLSGMAHQWVRSLVTLVRELEKRNCRARFVQVCHKVDVYFKSQGVDGILKVSKTLRDAQADLGVVTKKAIDTDFINPFLTATIKVLEVQTSTKATPGKIYVKKAGERFSGDISGVIGLVSDSFTGSVVVTFPEGTFLEIMARLLGEKYTAINKELEDGAGELINIIFGQAKIALNDKGYGVQTALPSVVSGKDHSVSTTASAAGVTVVVPFDSDAGKFFVEICTTG